MNTPSHVLKWLSWSLLLHACADFPLHHDDAHRQFYSFSDFRFASPISYWGPTPFRCLGRAALWLLNLVPFLYWG